jgi:uncharacterized repeat protein (TIGR03847 family)
MSRVDLGPAERFAAGALGTPGRRRFLLQVDAAGGRHSYLLEKGQLVALARRSLELLSENGIVPDRQAVELLVERGLEVDEPEDVAFRVGDMSIQLQESELVTVVLDSAGDETDGASFVVAPEQLQAMAVTALEVAAQGRPLCPRCRLPMDPEGHECPAVNGHRTG